MLLKLSSIYTESNKIINFDILVLLGTGGESLHEFIGYKPPYIAASQDMLYGFLNLKFTGNGSSVIGTFHPNDGINPIDEFTLIK